MDSPAGTDPANIANRTYTGAGTQLEPTTELRGQMFTENTRARRRHTTTAVLDAFVTATRLALTD
ncbi:poly-gamma-glutamate hydrolase family protein [Catenuloplanes niger]|uniref:poly-gamma-glutamate hydrolase family protein n=1 Tax=Catenuloplanes niger TaxID=587534 RepID=UPI00286CBF94|nr:poly-gamma-glutamate hydrolase family protein [Catenuloplanes niger]